MGRASPRTRAINARESFASVAECLGPVGKDASIFAVTRGQWSMIDAILHVIDCCKGQVTVSLWTWTVAEYEVSVLTRLRGDKRIKDATLIIDHGARNKNAKVIADWKAVYGPSSVRYVINHAKIATVEDDSGLRFLLRGSMNLNFNPRFEQFDLTEGGADFDLVREIEQELPDLNDRCSNAEVYKGSRVGTDLAGLPMFGNLKRWAK